MIRMIVAVDQGNAIGWTSGFLPWKLKADMKRFKELTTGGTVVMGFNTFKSLGRPNGLPNRKNIVLTRKPWSEARGHFGSDSDIDVISSLDHIQRLYDFTSTGASPKSAPNIWIIGGASVYEEALKKDMIDEIYMTLVHSSSGANVRLTTDLAAWKRFILTERKRGVHWEPDIGTRQWDGDFETSYLRLVKQPRHHHNFNSAAGFLRDTQHCAVCGTYMGQL